MDMEGLSMNGANRHTYYFEFVKIVRDLVHDYVNLTRFDLEIIDTIPFQRLKDIRQLTSQHVYPAARHTRFEHSLGVLELTRQAIKHLNKNQVIGLRGDTSNGIISNELEFNASLAALLHDIGHCPFSHMGETEFDAEDVRKDLVMTISEHKTLKDCNGLLEKLDKENAENVGSVHEQLSCIIILENEIYQEIFNKVPTDLEVDYDLIIRCILGIEYDVPTQQLFENYKEKNVVIRLINSSIFDMDKLDYIMRDSFFTGIGTPEIDTQRLFRNMHLNNEYSLVFTSKAVPALQNMIDARDGLYMYVYNHHAVIFSDFLNTYISRRLAHNTESLLTLVHPNISDCELKVLLENFRITSIGLVPRSYLFSVGAIVECNRSDSDWISLLNIINSNSDWNKSNVHQLVIGAVVEAEQSILMGDSSNDTENEVDVVDEISNEEDEISIDGASITKLTEKVYKAIKLVEQYMTRNFLKPWWKTVFEFNNFMHQNFRDDVVRKKVGRLICKGGDYGLKPDEFRSQIAKHVIYITVRLKEEGFNSLIEPLSDGDFFVIQRSTRFFTPDTIEKLEICLKSSEIIGSPADVIYKMGEYYAKNLTSVIPQKNYSSVYEKEGFYIFSKQTFPNAEAKVRRKHHSLIEQIFVFVASEFVRKGEQFFVDSFQTKQDNNTNNRLSLKQQEKVAEDISKSEMYEQYKEQFLS